jgi:YidC/Oxa1 family membrane protein insertase
MAQQQKILLYVLPFFFAIFGINFPVGVLLYWVTTNLWTMGQQFLVINRMHPTPATAGAATAKAVTGNGAPPNSGRQRNKGKPGANTEQPTTANGSPDSNGSSGAARRQPQRKKAKRKRGRPGGRH